MKRVTHRTHGLLLSLVPCCLILAGCSQEAATNSSTDTAARGTAARGTAAAAVDGSKFLLSEEPDGATDVIKAREEATDGDDVVLVGRIGGSANPWIDGRAAFSVVDGSLKACSDIPGDECKKPWDYCCETEKLPDSTAFVKIVDDNGDLVKAGAKELLNVEELSTVVVKGKAQRDDAGNLTVLTDSVYVRPSEPADQL